MIYAGLRPHYSAATHPPSIPPFGTLFQNLPSGLWSFTLTFRNTSHALWGVLWDPDVVWLRMEKVLNYVISAEGVIKSVLGDEVLKRHGSWPGLIDGLRWVIRRGGGYCSNLLFLFFFLQELGVSSPFSSPPACYKLVYCSMASFTAAEAEGGEKLRERQKMCVHVFNSAARRTPRLITAACLSLSHTEMRRFFGNEFCCHPASTHRRIGGVVAWAWLSVSRLLPPPLCPFCCREIWHRVELMNNKTGLVCLEGKKKKRGKRKKKKNTTTVSWQTHTYTHCIRETTAHNNTINRKTNLKADWNKDHFFKKCRGWCMDVKVCVCVCATPAMTAQKYVKESKVKLQGL